MIFSPTPIHLYVHLEKHGNGELTFMYGNILLQKSVVPTQ